MVQTQDSSTAQQAVELAGEAGASPEQGTRLSECSDTSSDSNADDSTLPTQDPTQESSPVSSQPRNTRFWEEPYETASLTQNNSFGVDALGNLLEDTDRLETQQADFTPSTQPFPKKPRLYTSEQSGQSDDGSKYSSNSDCSASSRASQSKSKLTDLQHAKHRKTTPSPTDIEEPPLTGPCYVITCTDACNGIYQLNCKAMVLWTVRDL